MAHAQYLTYAEYEAYGGTLSAEAYPSAEFRARKHIDYVTDCRVQNMAEVPEEIKLCMVSLINVEGKIGVDAQANNPLVASFNTDGYSESYGSAAEQSAALERATRSMIREMLYGVNDDNGTPLLYRGLDA